jgi:TRAP-type C4-dicarboxylate transport system substrate-binding protein
MKAIIVVAALLASQSARAEDNAHVIRFATVAPEGSSWAREFAAYARAVEQRTKGSVKIKFYFNGKAGSELEVKDRIEKDLLDGAASGGMMCGKVMPSMNVLRVTGVFQDRGETNYVASQLAPRLAKEAEAHGYTLLGMAALGASSVFSRTPIKTMAQLRKLKIWRWDLDQVAIALNKSMGLDLVPLPLEAAASAYDDGKVDGFYAIPTAALAFQWYAQAPYILDLPGDYLIGCLLMRTKALDALDDSQREAVKSETAKLTARFNDLGTRQDAQLLRGGVFNRQGSKLVPVSEKLRAEFFDAARQARDKLDPRIVSKELIKEVLTMLADYRGEHH